MRKEQNTIAGDGRNKKKGRIPERIDYPAV